MSITTSALSGDQANFLEELYQKYIQSAGSVPAEWAEFFKKLDGGIPLAGNGGVAVSVTKARSRITDEGPGVDPSLLKEMGVQNLLNVYRSRGVVAADLDPLGINKPDKSMIEERLANLSQEDLNGEFDTEVSGLGVARLRDVVAWFDKTYCSTVGSEVYYLLNPLERNWLQYKMEVTANNAPIEKTERLHIFEKLYQAEYFEQFLGKKFVGKKRFSLEGGETLIPMLDALVEQAGRYEMNGLVIGMAHRGRLNVLENIMDKPASLIFAEFQEKADVETYDNADVKYHLGYSNERVTASGKRVHLTLMFNPSHLEAVNPVCLGSVRARQTINQDWAREKYMGILIHGDAAFMGQGVVPETMNLMSLPGYHTGGTVHLVINNQIGFTTLPSESRSTPYCTDLAKAFQVPIWHVNGDDPEAAHRIMLLAMEYRQRYKKDVVIDLVCYRKYGHNETDEPTFTQPMMYEIIRKKPSVVQIYEKKLLETGISQTEIESIKKRVQDSLENSFKETQEKDVKISVDSMRGTWSGFSRIDDTEPETMVSESRIANLVRVLTTYPGTFKPHKKIQALLDSRKKMGEGQPLDWGMAEALALASIAEDKVHIRFTGQDAERGTFSHRHAVIVHAETGEKYTPINNISPDQGKLIIANSPLSEYAVMGFEYGFSLTAPNSLVVWEAQFGDFANGAQIIIDQFLSSSEVKWNRMSGLVLLLPHGYEGQGPEHSSARLERFLQLCARTNMIVCNCTTPAQFFHLLRRQVLRKQRKPLVVMTPKSLLRHPDAISEIKELTQGSFREIIADEFAKPAKVNRVLVCSGKIYYDLHKARQEQKVESVAIIRLEQLYPFEYKTMEKLLLSYKNIKEIFWVQEEPKNMGAWFYVKDRFDERMADGKYANMIKPIARKTSPSPAAGLSKVHEREQKELINRALTG